jgi:hypothetical protein
MRRDTLCRTCDFTSGGICGLRSLFGAFGERSVNALFFMLRWDRYVFHKNRAGTRHAEHVILHPVESEAHVVHSSASGARNVDALFFMLGWDRYRFDKKRVETNYVELLFLHPVGSMGHVVHSGASEA